MLGPICPEPAASCLPWPWRTTSPNTPPKPSAPPVSLTGPSAALVPSPPCAAARTTSGSPRFAGTGQGTCRRPARAQPVDPHARLPRPFPHQIPELLGHLHPAAAGPPHLPPRPATPRRRQRPLGRDIDERTILVISAWRYAGTGHATTVERHPAPAAAARAREHDRIAREELMSA